jgi:hypothetical protein
MEQNCCREPSKSAKGLGRGLNGDGWGLGSRRRRPAPVVTSVSDRRAPFFPLSAIFSQANRTRLPATPFIARPTLAA